MIRNANRNISVAKGHGYTFEKVKFALDFVNKAGRNTTLEDWVNAYNYIKGTNETAKGCQACKSAKFTAGVRNYAQYGYLTLLNEGYKQEDFLAEPSLQSNVEVDKPDAVEEPCTVFTENENSTETTENDCVEEKQPETVEAFDTNVEQTVVEETSPETCNEEKQVEEVVEEKPVIRKKAGRPKKEVKK